MAFATCWRCGARSATTFTTLRRCTRPRSSSATCAAERVSTDGRCLRPLDEAEAVDVIDRLAHEGIESVAVCLLHAYANPDHERIIERLAARHHPSLAISLSSEVLPEIKEFERTTTTVVNAYVKPLVPRYLERLEGRPVARGPGQPVFLVGF